MTTPQAPDEGLRKALEPTDDQVRAAMQDAWDEICSDTSCHPLDITSGWRKRLFFHPAHWADLTAMRLREALSAVPGGGVDVSQSQPCAEGTSSLPDTEAAALVKHMVDRFLGWRLPESFSPDAGISFKAEFNENTPWPMKHEPNGTNLFSAEQATAMVRHMIEGSAIAGKATNDRRP